MKLDELKTIIQEELKEFFKTHSYNLEDELIIENEIMLGELLDPNNSYPYYGKNGFYKYKDANDVEFFVRLVYQPTNSPYFEFKTGWFDKEGKTKYEPSIPPISPKSSAIDWDKRSNTVAKIYKEEILPFFETQNLSNIFVIKPISSSRMKFSERLVRKFTPTDKFDVEYGSIVKYDAMITVTKKA